MSVTGRMQLALEGALDAVRSARRALRGGGSNAARGELRPGSHLVHPTRIRESGGRQYLAAGPIHRSLWRTIEWRLLRPICAEMTRPIADVGCGDGEFGKTLFRVVDLKVDEEAETIGHCDPNVYLRTALVDLRREMPRAGGENQGGAVSRRGAADGSEGGAVEAGAPFATIFSNSTLEHIEGVDAALRNLAAATESGGRLVFTVPSSGLVRAFTAGYGRAYSDRLNAIFGHHNLWTAADWTAKLKSAGYTRIEARGYMTDAAAIWFASMHLPPWPQLERRSPDRVWNPRLPRFLDLVDESLEESAEEKTVCLLFDARK